MKTKQKHKDGFSEFVEKAVTPDDGVYTKRDFPEQNIMEAQKTFGQDYSIGNYDRLTKGLWVLIIVISIFLIVSVFLILYSSNKNLFVIHAYQDRIVQYELRLANKNRIWIKEVKYLGPSGVKAEYKGMEGKTALVARYIDRFDADIVICSEQQIRDLIDEGYLVDVDSILRKDASEYIDDTGIVYNDKLYGYVAGKGLKVIGTSSEMKFTNGEFIAVTESADTGRSRKSVIYFLEYYFDK